MEQLSADRHPPNPHVAFPHMLVVVRDPTKMVGIARNLMADRTLDIVRGVTEARRYLSGPNGLNASQVLCEDNMEDGTAEDVHRFLVETLRSTAFFLVLGGASISLAGRGVLSVPKPGDPTRIRAAFAHMADAYADSM